MDFFLGGGVVGWFCVVLVFVWFCAVLVFVWGFFCDFFL